MNPCAELGARGPRIRRFMGMVALGMGATFLAACGGGGASPVPITPSSPPTPPVPTLTRDVVVSTYAGSATQPSFSIGNLRQDRIDLFGADNAAGDFIATEAAVKIVGEAGTQNTYSVFFDADGAPSRINDEANRRYVLVKRANDVTRFEMYDSANRFQSGFAIVRNGAGPQSVAMIKGVPVVASQQIAGQLRGAINGSFAVVSEQNAGLDTPQDLPAAMRTYLTVPASAARGSVSRPAAVGSAAPGSISSGLDALIRTSAETYPIAGAVAGGLLLVGSPIAIPVAQVALVGFGVALAANTVRQALNNQRDQIPAGDQRDMYDSIFGTVSEPSPSAASLVSRLIDDATKQAASIIQSGTAKLDQLAETFRSRGGTAADALQAYLDPTQQPAPVSGPPVVDTTVAGSGVDSNNVQYRYRGTLANGGNLHLVATPDSPGTATITLDGTLDSNQAVTGSYSDGTNTGSFDGSAAPLGQCQTLTQSGGQGTFSYASDVGAASGTVSFSYNAYSIPDAFTVTNAGQTVFTTNGLVSGTGGDSFPISASTVFVTVSAPNNGTAWDFVLGCAS